MTIEKILMQKQKTPVYSIGPDNSIAEAAKLMSEQHIGALMVLDENQDIEGIISERDILQKCTEPDLDFQRMPVQELMTSKTKLIVSNKENDLRYVISIMAENHIRHIPILEGEKLVALVSMRDLVQALLAGYEKKLRAHNSIAEDVV